MSKTTTEIFNDKVNLIYEYDKQSPLFVRMANSEIERNNINKAIEILNGGIKHFPGYAAAYILLGKAYTLVGNYGKALHNIKTGCDIIHSPKSYEYYLKEIENIKKQRSLFELSKRKSFMPSIQEEETPEEPTFFEPTAEEESDLRRFEERLDEIAKEISHGKIADVQSDSINKSMKNAGLAGENLIVSETLAKIYVAQGEYSEAVKVYKKLKDKNPDKKEYYDDRIKEIQKDIDL